MASPLQYVPLASSIDTAFWSKFAKLKIDKLKLSTEPIPIKGSYNKQIIEGVAPLFRLGYDAFEKSSEPSGRDIVVDGFLVNTNTIQEFKKSNKGLVLKDNASNKIWDAIKNGSALSNPEVLVSFVVHMFADLKKYQFYYWVAFPAFPQPTTEILSAPKLLTDEIEEEQIVELHSKYYSPNNDIPRSFFCIHIITTGINIVPLTSYSSLKEQGAKIYLAFSDPCNSPTNPGWPLRNLLTLAAVQWPQLKEHSIICLRESNHSGAAFGRSLVVQVCVSSMEKVSEGYPDSLGWERNKKGVLGPKCVDLKATMNPESIAESAVDLNLNLMKWRLVPSLDLNLVKNTRCLLLGAGTLGCNVARCLMGWGVRKITFVDSGRVSYSNPVRQSLFRFEDCKDGGKWKAQAAAEALKEIFPRIDATGFNVTIPMPGHVIGSETHLQETKKNFEVLDDLIQNHDVIFLLTDSRESRWLPTVLGHAHDKLVITSALGFDSYLVMRHGVKSENSPTNTLGCYFCSDVVSPGDSTADRTLDQQCTVTRPGISYMAAAQAVEIMVSVLQHPKKAAAPVSSGESAEEKEEGILGTVPQSIRYYLSRCQHLTIAISPFLNCSACSHLVGEEYRKEGFNFLVKVFNDPSYLEEVAGLKKLQDFAEEDCWELGSDDSEEETI